MIKRFACLARALGSNQRGAMAVETAILAPALITLAIGGFEISSIVARQTELQSAAAEAAAIVRAALPETAAEREAIRDVLASSTGLAAANVSVIEVYRCFGEDDYTDARLECEDEETTSTFIEVTMSDTYQPVWTEFGLGSAMSFNVSRTIQVG